MPDRSKVVDLITESYRVSRKLVVVEINDPQKSYLSAKLMNDYYVHYLNDDFVEFFNFEDFKSFFLQFSDKTDFLQIRTFQGEYNIAVIEGKE